jgi:RIO-like serine/threonine protein kinase
VSARYGSVQPFTRPDLAHGTTRPLTAGRWANAVVWLHEHDGADWVVKDFRPRSWLVRNVIGRFLVRRELGGLRRLQGVPGTPQDAFRLDAFALAYRFVPGRSLRGLPAAEIPRGFFQVLERNVHEMHARAGLVHLDMRNADNIVVTPSGEPFIIDFQSQVGLRWMPGPLRRFAERVDHASIYKHWAKRSPETLGPERKAILDHINALRPLWAPRGYFGASRRNHDAD